MHRRLAIFVVVVATLFLSGCAGSSKYMVKSEAAPTGAPSDKSVVYVMRPSGFGFAINFQIWDRDQFIGLSQAKSYFAYVCDPGRHLFIAIAENKVAVDANLAPGKSYYMITEARMGGWKARVAMTPVTRGSELWDNVATLKSEMEYVVPVADEVRAWDSAKKPEAQALVVFFESDPRREEYLGHLVPEDGR